jgi:hypothetical protein
LFLNEILEDEECLLLLLSSSSEFGCFYFPFRNTKAVEVEEECGIFHGNEDILFDEEKNKCCALMMMMMMVSQFGKLFLV